MGLRKLECTTCGASLEPAPGADTVSCRYCHSTFRVPSQKPRQMSPQQASLPAARQVYPKTTLVAMIAPVLVMLLVGVGTAVSFVVRGASSATSRPAATRPAEMPTLPRALGGVGSKQDQEQLPAPDLAAKLDLYTTECFNDVSPDVLGSRYRYLDWVDAEEGPRRRGRNVYGLYEVSEPSDCAEAVQQASTMLPSRPELEAAAQAYLAAARRAHERVAEAYLYYERENYRDDDFARGNELHGPLMEAFATFAEAHAALEAQLDSAFDEVVGRRADALGRGANDEGMLVLQSQLEARRVAQTSNVPWRETRSIDIDAYEPLVEGYEQMIDRVAELGVADDDYVGGSRKLAQAAKELMRRVRDGRGWSTGNRVTLQAGRSSHWMVDGSPGKVVDAYNDLLRESPSPRLRWVAPVEYLAAETH